MVEIKSQQKNAARALKLVNQICIDNNIEFFLLAGSALGAVRHKGFIPWDDDIDIGMKLGDFKRFVKTIEATDLGEFEFSHYTNHKKHPRFQAKILFESQHLIDIFPIVKTSNNVIKRRSQWILKYLFWQIYRAKINMFHGRNVFYDILWELVRYFASIFSREKILKMARWNEARFEEEEAKYYVNLYSVYPMKKELIKAEWINNYKKVVFEKDKYLLFSDSHDYLTHLYGDYMSLPPEEERVPSHRGVNEEFACRNT